ncbi:diguanylate cyclase [Marinomonas sp. A79]|uniref:diguanylate cyclase n=1 Tax=Marinomonas vulgaris TaxID=2823372 RepID=A0ABS5HF80_9GAMM|nr:diguanylate cyclase [Marinomonas vulgaris]MBR7890270.1 diguanylate cyclase [Marinomonas vulgaris]
MIFKRFFVLLFLFSIAFLAISYPIYSQYYHGVQNEILATEEISVVAAKQKVQKEIYEQIHLLAALKSSVLLTKFVTNRTQENRESLESSFINISTNFHRFDQIRLLSNEGFELIRVNFEKGQGVAVPLADLQDKSQRYYFNETNRLSDHQVYVSQLDLNIEQGQIEQPHKPMLRIATPVIDSKGNRAGVLVVNYLAKGMLDNFRYQMSQRVGQQGMLIDPDGYWLSNHQRINEWGADLGRPEHTFSRLYPEAWPKISSSASGTVFTGQGVFRFESIEPLDFAKSEHGHFKADHYPLFSPSSLSNSDWKIVVYIPNDYIKSQSILYQPLGQLFFVLITLFVAGLAALVAILLTQQQARLIKQKELDDLYNHAPCGYHSLDKNGFFVRINQTELDWLGYSRDEVIGRSFVDFLKNESKGRFYELFDELKVKRKIENEVLEMQCKDGSSFHASSSVRSLQSERDNFAVARASVFDISDRIKLEKKLETLANIDPLTNVSNRRHFYEQANTEFKRAKCSDGKVSIIMFDIDYFKKVNDNYGHDVGDTVLKLLTNEVGKCLRDIDLFARFGGEEFIILLTEQSDDETARVAERIRNTVERLDIETPLGKTLNVTVSLGFTTLTPQDKELDSLIKKSDIALYQAKAQGRNRLIQYSDD